MFANIEAGQLELRKVSGTFNFGQTMLLTLPQGVHPDHSGSLEADPVDGTAAGGLFSLLKEEPAKTTLHIVIHTLPIGECSMFVASPPSINARC